jgi:hypothetical protein
VSQRPVRLSENPVSEQRDYPGVSFPQDNPRFPTLNDGGGQEAAVFAKTVVVLIRVFSAHSFANGKEVYP